jgi:hypothetical protein
MDISPSEKGVTYQLLCAFAPHWVGMMNNAALHNVTIGQHIVDAALQGFEEDTNMIN